MGAFCPSCGSQVEADWRFCRSCGSEQPISAAPSTPDPSAIADVAAPAASTTVERSDADRLAAMRLAEVEADRAAEAARQAELVVTLKQTSPLADEEAGL